MHLRLRDRYEAGRQVADDPLIVVVDDFVSPAERSHVVREAADELSTALVSAAGPPTISAGRTGSVAWLAHDRTPVVSRLVLRMSRFIGLPPAHAESLQVVRYRELEEYRPHFDGYDPATERGRQRTARGGQRLVTVLAYLNDVSAGGATVFPELGLEVDPRPGRAVVFHNVVDHSLDDLTRHPRSLHGGAPVRSGEKWACNLWFRHRRYRP